MLQLKQSSTASRLLSVSAMMCAWVADHGCGHDQRDLPPIWAGGSKDGSSSLMDLLGDLCPPLFTDDR